MEGGGRAFVAATKQVRDPGDIIRWEASEAYQEYLGFIIAIGDAVKGRKLTEEVEMSDCCTKLINLLQRLADKIEEFPPQDLQTRYGNPAYRDWFAFLENEGEQLLSEVVAGSGKEGAVVELLPYLMDSFGNSTRIDYGTGHEMAFVMLLCCLFRMEALQQTDRAAVGLKVFGSYMTLCRQLQQVYRMEPAGSMGVWNLDDYQFVAFIWGAAQLGDKARIKPKSIPDPEIAEMLSKENQFFACLAYIHKVKSGPFHEHSNQLWNISAVPNWGKVFTGLIKMYRAEVLCKFPVIQHSLFGSLLSLAPAETRNPLIPETDIGPARPGPPVLGADSPRPPKFLPRAPGMPLVGSGPPLPGGGNLPSLPGGGGLSSLPGGGSLPSLHPSISPLMTTTAAMDPTEGLRDPTKEFTLNKT